jgi:hypothetical protein
MLYFSIPLHRVDLTLGFLRRLCATSLAVPLLDTFSLHVSSRDSVVGTAIGYGLDDRGVGVLVPVQSRIFSSPRSPDRLWGPPNHLSNGYRWLLPRG